MGRYADDVKKPDLPYMGPIGDHGLRPGAKIVVKGKVLDDPNRFHINLQCGEETDPRSDVAFHFNPRFNAGVIVRNSFIGGWGDEERELESDFPFAAGEKFTVVIHVGKKFYNVNVNGQKFLRYAHRIEDLSTVNTIAVAGDFKINAIEISEGGVLSYPYEEVQTYVCRPEIPYTGDIPFGSMGIGGKVVVQGRVNEGASRFHINFMAGDDVAFHFNPRLGGGVVVRNCKQGGWGDEEREQPCFPFAEGENFEIAFICTRKKFRVAVNNKMFCNFVHRIEDISAITGLEVKGDAEIFSIHYEEKGKLHLLAFNEAAYFLKVDELPFIIPLPEELDEGTMIAVSGIVDDDAPRFHINLQMGEDEDSDVAFHFNPRFGKGIIVRNNRVGGEWNGGDREDELDGDFPFERGCFFQVLMVVEKDCIKVSVNGNQVLDFNHRHPLEEITHLLLAGGFRPIRVQIE